MKKYILDYDNELELPDDVKIVKICEDYGKIQTNFHLHNSIYVLMMGFASAKIIRVDLITGKQRTNTVTTLKSLVKLRDELQLRIEQEYLTYIPPKEQKINFLTSLLNAILNF